MALEKIPKTSLEDVVEQKSVVSEVLLPDVRDNELSFQGIDGAESRAQLSREESKHDSNGQSLEQSIVDERHQFKVVLDTSMAVSPATTVTVDNSLHLDASEHNHENALKFSTDGNALSLFWILSSENIFKIKFGSFYTHDPGLLDQKD